MYGCASGGGSSTSSVNLGLKVPNDEPYYYVLDNEAEPTTRSCPSHGLVHGHSLSPWLLSTINIAALEW